jgi:hypothetical protein
MARLVHKSTDGLDEQAVRVMVAGFRARKTYAAIRRDLAEMGVEVAERTIARRGQEWLAEERRRRETREWAMALVEAAKTDPEANQIVTALTNDAMLSNPDAFTGSDPVKIQRLNLQAEKNRIEARKQDLANRRLALDEGKFELLKSREQRAKAALEKPEAAMSAEERLKEIQAIYGIGQGANV